MKFCYQLEENESARQEARRLSSLFFPLDLPADPSIFEGTKTVTYEQLLEQSRHEGQEDLEIEEDPERTAIVLYTSGSTGTPKGKRFSFLDFSQGSLI